MFFKKLLKIHKKSTASEEKYIPLSEAAKYTPYSAEYLSLRARQGKLRAIKIGKIWVTKREWIEEYLRKYQGKENTQLPTSFFQLPKIKTEILFALTLLLFFVSFALAKDSLKSLVNDFVPVLKEVGEDFVIGANLQFSKIGKSFKNVSSLAKEGAQVVTENFGDTLSQTSQKINFGVAAIGETTQKGLASVSEFFKEYFQWLGENFLAAGRKIKNFGLGIKESVAGGAKGVGEKISGIPGLFKKKPEKIGVQKGVPEEITKKITSLEEKIKELEARPPQIKEVEVERKVVVQPVKEVEKITEFIPSEELSKIKSQLAIFGEITKKIQPTPPYTTAPTSPIYIQQGIQTGGAGIFASLAAESAAFRTLGVGASVTLGSDSRDKLTVNSVSQFNAPITVGQNALTIDTSGNIKTQGSAEIAGNLITQGLTEFKSPFTLTSTSTPQLSIRYDELNKLDISVFSTGAVNVSSTATTTLFAAGNANQLVLGSNGNVGIGTETPLEKLTISGNILGTGNLTIQGLTSLATTTISTQLTVPKITSLADLTIDPNGNLIISKPTTISANFTVLGTSTLATTTLSRLTITELTPGSVLFAGAGGLISQDNSNLFWDNTNKRLGIGTSTPSQKLDVQGGNINVSGSLMTGGVARIDSSGNLINIGNITLSGTISGTYTIGGTPTLASSLTGSGSPNITGIGLLSATNLTISGTATTTNLNVTGLTNLATTTISTQLSVPLITSPSTLTISPSSNATTTITGPVILASQTGNVGIGTTAPSQRLTVAGNIGIQAGANAFIGTLDNFALSLRTNNTDRIFITNAGNVGIGTTAPGSRLDVRVSSSLTNIAAYKIDLTRSTDSAYLFYGASSRNLRNAPSIYINEAYNSLAVIYRYVGADSAYWDETMTLGEWGGSARTLLADTSDILYFGRGGTFSELYFDIATAGAGYNLVWEYWNGTAWAPLTVTDGTSGFSADGWVTWTTPGDWATVAVGPDTTARYYVRVRTTTTPTTVATAYFSNIGGFQYAYGSIRGAFSDRERFRLDQYGQIVSYVSEGRTPFMAYRDEPRITALGGNGFYYGSQRNIDSASALYLDVARWSLDSIFYYDGTAFTDRTAALRQWGGSAYTLLADTDDIFYFGDNLKFSELYFDIGTAGAGYSLVWEYWNGTAWTSLNVSDGTKGFSKDGWVFWTAPADWTTATVNGVSKYWIRVRTTTAPTTVATAVFADISGFSGYFARFYDQNYEKLRVDYLGQLYTAGVIYPGSSAEGGTIQTSNYIAGTATGIGIGTTAPSYPLHVKTSGSTNVKIEGSGSGYADLRLKAGTDSSEWEIWTDATNNYLDFYHSGSKMTILTNGNVGIGTTAPVSLLELYKTDASPILTITAATSTTYSPQIAFRTGTTPTTKFTLGVDISTGKLKIVPSSDISTSTGITIDSSGNVGIGTTAPTEKLDVAGNIKLRGNLLADTDNVRALGTASARFTAGYIVSLYSSSITSRALDINTGGTGGRQYGTRFILDANGANPLQILSQLADSTNTLRNADILLRGAYWSGSASIDLDWYLRNTVFSTTAPRSRLSFVAPGGSEPMVIREDGNVGIGTTAPSSRLTIAAGAVNGEFAIGDFNAKVVDDMEDVSDWSSSDGTYTPISLESTNVKVGNYALKISTTVSNSNGDTVTKTISNENWSSYGKLGFWIRASYTTTSTDATTSQIISIQFHDTGGNTQTRAITIKEFDQWQYEEWDISGVASTDRDAVDWIGFRIDNDYGSPVFYIDQIRLYSSTERTGEIFVDKSGSLVIMGRNTTEIYAPNSSSGQLPGLKVGPAVTEINQPLSVNVGGDVGLSYDLVFLNTGLSSITSEGSLQILAGAPYRIANLTLGTRYNPGARDSGTSSGSNTATTLNDTTKSWATSTWVGGAIRITAGTGAGQVRAICANTPTQITVCDPWTTIPDTTSKYEIIGMPTGGDVIVDIGGANFASGGFKIFGADEGGAVFRVSPTGDVEIGSSGGWGEGKLIVKGGIILRGGNLQANKLSAPTGLNSTTQNSGGSLSGAVATYYYKVTAINDDGTETTPSATRAQSLTPLSAPTPSLTVNTTGTTYYAYRVAVYTSNGTSTPSTAVTTNIGADPPNNTISWSAVSGASGYILYRQKATTTADWEWIDMGTSTSYNDTSGTWPATTTLPTANNARTNTNIITLSWNVVPGAKGYKVYRGTDDVWGNADDRLVDNGVIFTNQVVDDGVGDSSGQVSPPTTNTTGGDLTIQGYITMANSTYQTLVTRVKAGAPTESDANGALVVDSADGRFYFRYGDTWHYVAQTAGFEIPANEIYDPITGQLISEGDFVLGWINEIKSDSARHGLWVRFDTVKDKIFSEFKEKIKNEFKFSIDDSGYLVVEKIKAKEIKAEKICLDDICITKEELRQLLESRNKEVGSMNGGESGGTNQESIINNSTPTESTPTEPTTESPSSTNETNL